MAIILQLKINNIFKKNAAGKTAPIDLLNTGVPQTFSSVCIQKKHKEPTKHNKTKYSYTPGFTAVLFIAAKILSETT